MQLASVSKLLTCSVGVTGREARLALNTDRHQSCARSEIEQLAPVRRPQRLRTTILRDRPLSILDVRERPHVDLVLARGVRLVGEPPAVGRDLPVPFEHELGRSGAAPESPRGKALRGRGDPPRLVRESRICSTHQLYLPSGVKAYGRWPFSLSVRRSIEPVPSAAFQYRLCSGPSRLEANATCSRPASKLGRSPGRERT